MPKSLNNSNTDKDEEVDVAGDDKETGNEPEGNFASPPDDPFSAMKDSFGGDNESQDSEKIPAATAETLATMIVYGVDILHDEIAKANQYPEFALTDKEKEMWHFVMVQLIPSLPIKYAAIIITVVILSLVESRKIIGLAMTLQKRKQLEAKR